MHIGEMIVAYRSLAGKPERKRTLGRRWRRWNDNVDQGNRVGMY